MIGLELEHLILNNDKPLRRREWLKALSVIEGREVREPLNGSIIGKELDGAVVKTDTTSAILELSLPPTDDVRDALELRNKLLKEILEVLNKVGVNARVYQKAYLQPSRSWYLLNATPRSHYRLLQWYGYSHHEISLMASSQVWLDVRREKLACVLNALNYASPYMIVKYANSPFSGWKEYRVMAWIKFTRTSWAAIEDAWAPKVKRDLKEWILHILSGELQEGEKGDLPVDLYGNSLSDLLNDRGVGRDASMREHRVGEAELIEGMQRWLFGPAIPRWKAERGLIRAALEGEDPSKYINKSFVEFRALPYLGDDKLEEAIELLIKIAENCESLDFKEDRYSLKYWYLKAAKEGTLPPWSWEVEALT